MDTHEVTGKVKEWEGKAEQGYGKVKDKVAGAVSDVSKDYSSGQEFEPEISGAFDDAMDIVRRRPLEAVGLSVLVGAGLGALLALWSRD